MDSEKRKALAASLAELVGEDAILLTPETDAYRGDYSGYSAPADVVVRPTSTEEVAKVLRYCTAQGVPVVPSGGRTGFCGGATPSQGGIVLSLERLNFVDPVDTSSFSVRVGAGAITQAVHEHCEAVGLSWPIDLASRGSSQIGGNISTNAGGIHVVRYGMTRNWVLGLEVVTMNGEVLKLDRPLVKNNTGLDILQLFVGTEGTLGVITAAVLRLTSAVQKRWTAFFAVRDEVALEALVHKLRSAPFSLLALEFLDDISLERAKAFYKTGAPLDVGARYSVVAEYELGGHSQEALETWMAAIELDGLIDAVAAQSRSQRAKMWLMREGLGEAWTSMGSGRTHDVSVPVSKTPSFLARLRERAGEEHPDWTIYACGHLGDGNVHTHLVAPPELDGPGQQALWQRYDEFVFRIVVDEYGGSVSAEHGIGLAKKRYLPWCRSPTELAIFRSLKQALDPQGLLNPGKIVD